MAKKLASDSDSIKMPNTVEQVEDMIKLPNQQKNSTDNSVKDTTDTVKKTIEDARDSAVDNIKQVSKEFNSMLDMTRNSIKQLNKEIQQSKQSMGRNGITGSPSDYFKDIKKNIADNISKSTTSINSFIKSKFNSLLDMLKGFGKNMLSLPSKLISGLNGVFGKIKEGISHSLDGLKTTFNNVKESISKSIVNITTAFSKIKETFLHPIDSLKGALSKMKESVMHPIDSIKGMFSKGGSKESSEDELQAGVVSTALNLERVLKHSAVGVAIAYLVKKMGLNGGLKAGEKKQGGWNGVLDNPISNWIEDKIGDKIMKVVGKRLKKIPGFSKLEKIPGFKKIFSKGAEEVAEKAATSGAKDAAMTAVKSSGKMAKFLTKIPGMSKVASFASKGGLKLLGKVGGAALGFGLDALTSKSTEEITGKKNNSFADKAISKTGQTLFGNVGDKSLGSRAMNSASQALKWGAIGSVVPVVGTAIGATLGAITGFIGGDTIAKTCIAAKNKLVGSIKSIGSSAWNMAKSVGKNTASMAKSIGKGIAGLAKKVGPKGLLAFAGPLGAMALAGTGIANLTKKLFSSKDKKNGSFLDMADNMGPLKYLGIFGVISIFGKLAKTVKGTIKKQDESNNLSDKTKNKYEELNKVIDDNTKISKGWGEAMLDALKDKGKDILDWIKNKLNGGAPNSVENQSGDSTAVPEGRGLGTRLKDIITGGYTPSGSLLDQTMSAIMKHEGTVKSVNMNDNNHGVSLGSLQWNSGRAQKYLQGMYNLDPEKFKQIMGNDVVSSLSDTKKWNNHQIIWDKSTKEKYQQLVNSDQKYKDYDLQQARNDVSTYLRAAEKRGVRGAKEQMFFADTMNQAGLGGAEKILENGTDLESMYASRMKHYGKWASRVNSAYADAKNAKIDGSNPGAIETGLNNAGNAVSSVMKSVKDLAKEASVGFASRANLTKLGYTKEEQSKMYLADQKLAANEQANRQKYTEKDLQKYMSFSGNGGVAAAMKLQPEVLNALMNSSQEWFAKHGKKVNVSSSVRTAEEQAKLYSDYKSGHGNLAAKISNHQRGTAFDIGKELNQNPEFISIMAKYKLIKPEALKGRKDEVQHYEGSKQLVASGNSRYANVKDKAFVPSSGDGGTAGATNNKIDTSVSQQQAQYSSEEIKRLSLEASLAEAREARAKNAAEKEKKMVQQQASAVATSTAKAISESTDKNREIVNAQTTGTNNIAEIVKMTFNYIFEQTLDA